MKRKTVTARGWAWTEYRNHRLNRDTGTPHLQCAICHTHTPTGGWHLDHYPHPLKDLQKAFPDGLSWNELDHLTRWLCRNCNLRRSHHRTDKQVRALNRKATNRNQHTPTTTAAKNPNSWHLEPNTTHNTNEGEQ